MLKIKNLTTNTLFKHYAQAALNYLPGLVILFFGMIALSASLVLIDRQGDMRLIPETISALDNIFRVPEKRLYWSIIALGFSGFLLFMLNAEKLRKIKAADVERGETFKLLESRLQAMEVCFDGIGIIDRDGNLSYMNKALMSIHGIPFERCDKYLNRSWLNLYSEEGQEEITKNVMPLLHKNKLWRGESPIRRKDGQVIVADLSLTLMEDGSFIGTARDISKRKKVEREQEELQKQFFQAQKMEAIGRLAGGIAHDFNNILAAMNGYAEFLMDDLDETSEQYGFASNIIKAGNQAGELVDQMLTLSRIKDGGFEIINLQHAVKESVSILKASLPKSIELTEEIDESHGVISGNATQISQVVMNLCVNAIDAMSDEKGEIRVGLKPYDKNDKALKPFKKTLCLGKEPDPEAPPRIIIEELSNHRTMWLSGGLLKEHPYVVLSIQDTGSGMSKDVLEKVIEPFFTTKAVDKGTGLGLSTVHGVIRGHKGAMMIDTVLGEGTTFHLFLPLAEEASLQQTEVVAEVENTKLTGHILLVEDQEEVADVTTIMLKRIGFEVSWAINGLDALDILRENLDVFSCVVTDLNMPKMTGLELLYETESDGIDIPFVLLSGYSRNKVQELIKDHPKLCAVLHKPIKQKDLAQVLTDILGNTDDGQAKRKTA